MDFKSAAQTLRKMEVPWPEKEYSIFFYICQAHVFFFLGGEGGGVKVIFFRGCTIAWIASYASLR